MRLFLVYPTASKSPRPLTRSQAMRRVRILRAAGRDGIHVKSRREEDVVWKEVRPEIVDLWSRRLR